MDEEQVEHSPLPWRQNGALIDSPIGLVTEVLSDKLGANPADIANAEHIVRAVNAHADLLSACEESLNVLEDWGKLACECEVGDECVMCMLKRAVAKAREEVST